MTEMSGAYAIVRTTVSDEPTGQALADRIVRERLAACVQLVPIQSVYWWKGAIEREAEILLLAKTPAARAERLVAWIRKEHAYEVPEIVVTPITGGLPEYLAWISKETEEAAPGADD